MGWQGCLETAIQSLGRRKSVWVVARVARGAYYAVVGVFAIFAVSMVALLIGSLAVHLGQDLFQAAQRAGSSPSYIDYGGSIDPIPEKLDGTSSYEFEGDDIERAESASPEVEAYCAEAVSEAQRVGCLSHVDPSEVP